MDFQPIIVVSVSDSSRMIPYTTVVILYRPI